MYSGPIIDCDVHHTWKKRTDLTQYLPREWRRYADGQGLLAPVFPAYRNRHRDAKRVDAWPPDGSPPGSDYQTLRTQLLDPLAVRRALLLFDTGTNAGHPNMYFATELVEAMNRWTVDYWLDGVDDRLFGGLLVPVQQPDEAAKVIRSKGQNERFATVLLNWNPGRPSATRSTIRSTRQRRRWRCPCQSTSASRATATGWLVGCRLAAPSS